jgi:hypothetical protein
MLFILFICNREIETYRQDKMNNYETIFLFIVILAIISLLIVKCSHMYNTKVNYKLVHNTNKEGFLDYQDVKTKTMNWCNKMQQSGLLNADQFNQCIASFKDVTSGPNSSGISSSKAGMSMDFSLYNTRAKKLSSSVSNTGDNTNIIMMMTPDNMTIGCKEDGTLYQIGNIDDPNVNQKELYFTLSPINETAFSILSPYGKFLNTDNAYIAGFNGKTIGPLATWNIIRITDADTNFGNISKIMIESVQFPNFHLVYNVDTNSLSIQSGKNEMMIWSIITKPDNIDSSKDNSTFGASQFIVLKEGILIKYKRNALFKQTLASAISAVNKLSEQVNSNYEEIHTYIQNYLQRQMQLYNATTIDYKTRLDSISKNSMIPSDVKETLIAGIPKPQGLNIKGDIINQVITAIDDKRKITQQYINSNALIPLQQQLDKINSEDTSQAEYDDLIANINTQIQDVNNQIVQNRKIIDRQKDKYNTFLEDYQYESNTINRLDKVDKISELNMKMLDSYKSQRSYLTKIYPVIIFFLFIGLIYLCYVTLIKFKNNVWSKYKD